jgi:hypothetical protein
MLTMLSLLPAAQAQRAGQNTTKHGERFVQIL